MGYDPYFENSPVLDAFLESYYQYQMVVLGWMVDLVSISTNTEVKKLVYQFDMPREVHVGDVLHVYAYLTKCNSIFALVQIILTPVKIISQSVIGSISMVV